MKKSLKTITMLAAVAALTVGASLTAMAASANWYNDGETWHYVDRDGDYVCDEWEKDGSQYYYLDEDGNMAKNALIENGDYYYYVNSSGRRVTNEWRYVYSDDEDEEVWMFFQSDGKSKQNGFLTIDGVKYHFTDNVMDTGWLDIDDDLYYFEDDDEAKAGAMQTKWRYFNGFDDDDDSPEDEGWYYFGTNGKVVKNCEKKIDGKYYAFDSEGLMQEYWVSFDADVESGSDATYKYYKPGDGYRVDGWKYLEDCGAADEGKDSEEGWYYFKNGVPYTSTYKTTEIADGYGVAKIDGDTYCFDENGLMQTGKVDVEDGDYFYFTETEGSSEGKMKYGKVTIKNADDLEDGTYYFTKSGDLGVKGKSYTGDYDGYLYDHGERKEAEEDTKYQIVEVDGKEYLVNESGKITKKGTVKDSDGRKYTVTTDEDGDYVITVE